MNLGFYVEILYSLITLVFLAITVILVRSKNGLKIEFLMMFCALTWGSFIRTIEPDLPPIVPSTLVDIIVGIPILLSGGYLVIYLLCYLGNNKEK